ncbi:MULTISPECIES: DUF3592 domain-containing protein [unclassified Halorubrum]|uniref:DUF3592 domain-containing protein n=1 Tax=unclassified Halorubrum TaxID=2642239 RepID=UPI0010F8130E|nr:MULTISPECIES: DUF3592 domain-containing protein [unclassified Halorubrum]TKX43963.1 DUF3592 domain-containing protein [Halorubrum sp. ARQ200]TKX50304.1 DUF3592 domain-containing protein [Halorubrum sp. ASP121]TKX59815.1 DUF3592 domain-containing protein [Halorubrum sp. ASP1]
MEFTVRGVAVTVTPVIFLTLVLGLGIAGYGAYDYVQQSNAVHDAVAVETTVVDTSISRSNGRRFYYRISVEHTYEYQGREYTSEQVFPGSTGPIYTVRSDAQRIIEPYESDETATAYVTPDNPSGGFLKQQTIFAPFRFIGFGSLLALLTALHAIGARNPGQNVGISQTTEREPTRYDTVFGFNRDTLSRISKRLMLFTPAVFFLSLVTIVALLLNSEGSSLQVSVTDPVGFAFFSALLSVLGFVFGLTLYGIWSFTEYRRLRERIPDPRPPSPFRHPSRLVTIMYSRDDLDIYGRRVKLTGFVFALIVFLIGIVAFVLVTAS